MEIFIDDNGNESQVGFDGVSEEARQEQAKAELIKEEYGEPTPLILGKFQNQDALAKSYSELESEAGRLRAELAALKGAPPAAAAPSAEATPPAAATPADEPPVTPPPATPPAAEQPPAIPPERQQQIIGAVLAQAGGDTEFAKLADWASKNLEPARIQVFNDALTKGDEQLALMSLRAIQYDRMMKNGYEPPLMGGKAVSDAVKPFRSEQEVTAAMADYRYSGVDADPAYIEDVTRRLAASPAVFMGR